VNGQIFHPANEVERIATVLALAETIPQIFFQIHPELCLVRAFVDGAWAGQVVSTAFEGVEQIVMLQHLFHRQPGTDVPEVNEWLLFFWHGVISFEGSLCGSGIEPRPMGNDTMPCGTVDKQ
jgi:hypothetical protein